MSPVCSSRQRRQCAKCMALDSNGNVEFRYFRKQSEKKPHNMPDSGTKYIVFFLVIYDYFLNKQIFTIYLTIGF